MIERYESAARIKKAIYMVLISESSVPYVADCPRRHYPTRRKIGARPKKSGNNFSESLRSTEVEGWGGGGVENMVVGN